MVYLGYVVRYLRFHVSGITKLSPYFTLAERVPCVLGDLKDGPTQSHRMGYLLEGYIEWVAYSKGTSSLFYVMI